MSLKQDSKNLTFKEMGMDIKVDEFKCDHDIIETCEQCDGFQPETLKFMEETTVRENLMSDKHYTPYCGANMCNGRWPRTVKTGDQYKCPNCGWLSGFPQDFIDRYKKRWS